MRGLSPQEILSVWETGQDQHPIDRALTMLAPVFPGARRRELAELTIGRRDAHLLTLREHTFGEVLKGFAVCPECSQQIEFSLAVADIRVEAPPDDDGPLQLTVSDCSLGYRIPTSVDLAAVASSPDAAAMRRALVERCILQSTRDGEEVSAADLYDTLAPELARAIAQRDPQADVELGLSCTACDTTWQLGFDILSFLWTELADRAKRLLDEVHMLASAYGWREADILSLSPVRRRHYLERVM